MKMTKTKIEIGLCSGCGEMLYEGEEIKSYQTEVKLMLGLLLYHPACFHFHMQHEDDCSGRIEERLGSRWVPYTSTKGVPVTFLQYGDSEPITLICGKGTKTFGSEREVFAALWAKREALLESMLGPKGGFPRSDEPPHSNNW